MFASLSKNKASRLEFEALTALHAFPALYCRGTIDATRGPAAILDKIFREELRARLTAMSFLKRKLITFIWPPAMVMWGLGLILVNGRFVARHYRRGLFRQFADQMRLAFTQGIPVSFFYTYELHEPRNQPHAREFVLRGHIKGGGQFYKRLYRGSPERKTSAAILNDKLAFHRFCSERNLPVAQLFAFAEKETIFWADDRQRALPPTDLFFKPRRECGGTGAERWIHVDGCYRSHSGDCLDSDALTNRLIRLSRQQSYLVFECLTNHHEIRDLSAGALSTLRMHTMLNEKGEVEHLFTMFRMSQLHQRIVDTADGIAAAVDPITGSLGRASNSSMLARWHDHHPFSKGRITGRRIPFWHDALKLAVSTHEQLGTPYIVGWDIAITERGPTIIEANRAPDVEIEQRLDGPWGNSRFGELLVYHLTNAGRTIKTEPNQEAAKVAQDA